MLTLTLGLGIAVSLALFQLTGLSAGGVIAPGYLALVLDRPGMLATIALAAFATWGLLLALSRVLFLYGTRRFGVAILLALVLTTGIQALRGGLGPIALEWGGLGFIVPGLIAHQMDRQGPVRTLLMIAIATPLTRALAVLVVPWWS
ncbi:poly-gamma-glutamate biosynthesis protein PgsC/CapC [Nitratireductor arenosus]|uniref:poly-gamma-glutamate biosynthesis protein PgsC/CapC n=1 Tax=Nitratireductor arenosus TaxID=2682096 RepID=UPI0018D23686